MSLGGFFKKARLSEIFLMTGFVLIAIPFVGPIEPGVLVERTLLLFVSNFLLLVAVYSANSYFGYKADRINPRLNANQFSSARPYLAMTAMTLVAAIVLLWMLHMLLPVVGFLSFVLWICYSAPGGAKSRPVVGTLVHLFGQVLQFHLCVMAFRNPSPATLAISIYFGLLFSAGHLMHEVKDHESDAAAGIRTNTVVFGVDRVISAYKVAVLLICGYWISIHQIGYVETRGFAPFLVASLAHAVITWFPTRATGDLGSTRHQTVYRVFYLVAGVATFGLLLSSN